MKLFCWSTCWTRIVNPMVPDASSSSANAGQDRFQNRHRSILAARNLDRRVCVVQSLNRPSVGSSRFAPYKRPVFQKQNSAPNAIATPHHESVRCSSAPGVPRARSNQGIVSTSAAPAQKATTTERKTRGDSDAITLSCVMISFARTSVCDTSSSGGWSRATTPRFPTRGTPDAPSSPRCLTDINSPVQTNPTRIWRRFPRRSAFQFPPCDHASVRPHRPRPSYRQFCQMSLKSLLVP